MGSPSPYHQLLHKKRKKTVTCRECGKRLQRISGRHLSAHGLTRETYWGLHGRHDLVSEEVRFRQAAAKLRWSEPEIIAAFREMDAAGERMNPSWMERTHPALFEAAVHMFGAWQCALNAAGVDVSRYTSKHWLKEWSKERIVRSIRGLHQKGADMGSEAVQREAPLLVSAARVHFRGWTHAIRAAGIDEAGRDVGEDLRKRKVIKAILARAKAGLPMNYVQVTRDDRPLANAANCRFGSWGAAIQAAGLDPDGIRCHRRWSMGKIVARIRRFASDGHPLNHAAVCRRDAAFVHAARQYFESWDAALRAAGFDPGAHRLLHPPWTRAELIAWIRRKGEAGEDLRAGSVEPKGLHSIANRLFGSWKEALLAAGLNPEAIQGNTWMTQVEVIEQLYRLHQEGVPLNYGSVRKRSKRLVQAGARWFGGWSQTLEAAGFDSQAIFVGKVKWTRERILGILEKRRSEGLPLNPKAVEKDISLKGARRVFGSYPNALRAAGVDPETVYLSREMKREEILDSIRTFATEGTPLNARSMCEQNSRLITAARKTFGNWHEALRQAGLNPEKYRKTRPPWTPEEILSQIRTHRSTRFESLSQRVLRSLQGGARRHFGSWQAALDAASSQEQDTK